MPDELSRQLVAGTAPEHARAEPNRVIVLSETLLTACRENRDTALVVHLTGQVDMLTAPVMRTELDAALDEAPHTLVADLTGLTFLGSVGIAELIRVRRHAVEHGRRFVVVVPPFIRRLLDLTGLAGEFDLVKSGDDVPA